MMTPTARSPVSDLAKAALRRFGGKDAAPATSFLRGLKSRDILLFDATAAAAINRAFAGEKGNGFDLESADLVALFEQNLGTAFVARVRDTGIYREGKIDRTPAEDLMTFTLYRPEPAQGDLIVVETAYIAGAGDRDDLLQSLAEDSLRIHLRARAFIDDADAGLVGHSGTDAPATEEEMMTVLGWLYLLLRHHADGKIGYSRLAR